VSILILYLFDITKKRRTRMAGVNKAILVGRLGKDPEMRYTPGGDAVATFSVATS